MNVITATIGALIAYLITSWVTMTMALHLSGNTLYIAMALLGLVGVAAALIWVWIKTKFQFGKDAKAAVEGVTGGGGGDSAAGDETEALVREAETRLASSQMAQGANFGNLPLFFIIGDQATTKTSIVLHSGLEPELLAGQVYQDNAVIPTRSLNLWFARNAIFAEAAAKVLADTASWTRAIRRLKPGALKSATGKGVQSPRAAILCFNCEVFQQPNAQDLITTAARNLNARLSDIAQTLGINFPVYVLFTKTDRLPFFPEFVRNLSPDEATQVLGITLPMRASKGTGIYTEEETKRLTHYFNMLFYALADKRLEFLPREHDTTQLPGAYEFPREFRKLRGSVVQFLLDVGRPSQLSNSAFLRGFYFSAVRPVTVNETAPIPQAAKPSRQAFEAASSATSMFRVGGGGGGGMEAAAAFQPQQVTGARKVPQWVFLGHLFNDVVLQDRAAMGVSGASTKPSTTRRVLFGALAGLSLFLTLMFVISYVKNHSMLAEAQTAARKIAATEGQNGQVPSQDAMQNLDALLASTKTLTGYHIDGAPFLMRWGLFTGEDAYPAVRALYYDKLRQLMFGETREGMRATLDKLPFTPGPTDDFNASYNVLKGYLITASRDTKPTNYDYRSKQFLTPLMLERWAAAHPAAPPQLKEAFRKHLDFYSDDPNGTNPLPLQEDGKAVATGRNYLNKFQGFQRVYASLLTEVGKKVKPVNYNATFPGTNEVIINNKDVAGPFTKDGFAAMQDAIRNVDKKFVIEKWVLELNDKDLDYNKMKTDLANLYQADLIKKWKEYLQNTQYVKYQNLGDAAAKLGKLVGAQTPILALLGLASQNTAVDNQKVKDAFRSVQYVVSPANTSVFQTDANKGYTDALANLQNSVREAAEGGATPDKAAATRAKALDARNVVIALSRNFGVDTDGVGALTQRILEEPITSIDKLVQDMGPAELNKKGAGLCAEVSKVFSKFPFSGRLESPDAKLEEVSAVFHPGDGALWKFYEDSLKAVVDKQGNHFVRKPNATPVVSQQFLDFLNNSSDFANAFYPSGSATPKLNYAVKGMPSQEFQSYTLNTDGKTLVLTPGGPAQQATFTGSTPGLKWSGKTVGGERTRSYEGIWAPFRFFYDANSFVGAASPYLLTFEARSGKSNTLEYSYQFQLDTAGLPPIFNQKYFAGLRCQPIGAK